MGFLDKIKSVFIGNMEAEEKKPAEVTKTDDNNNNSISSQAALMKNIEKTLKGYYKGQKASFEDKILKVWVSDTLLYDSLKASNFVKDLICCLDNEMGVNFHTLELYPGPLPSDHNFTKVSDSVHLELCNRYVAKASNKAEIRALDNYGSLKENVYTLDSNEIVTLPLNRYNIGIGRYPDMPGVFRENHIAIDDAPDCAGFERNRYVSRKHAFIRYSPDAGFMLQAELEGTKKAGKRTRILRAEGEIEVDDFVAQPLKDGDCIELSKNVRLLFKLKA